MTSFKQLFKASIVCVIAFVAPSCCIIKAQTPDTRPRATVSITGRVTIGEKPAPGVTIAATTLNFPQMLVAQTVSDADGKYRLSGLTAGQINVSAVAPTYVMPVSPMSNSPGRVLNLSTDESLEGIDFKLTRGAVITGRVIEADGKPVMGERVMLTFVDEKGEPLRNQVQFRPANPWVLSTDDRGIYRVYGLPAGRYKVSVGDNGGGAALRAGYYRKTFYPDTTEIAKAEVVELGEGSEAKNIDITMAPRSRTYSVSGRIIDADTGEPVVGINYAFGTLNQTQTQMGAYASPSTPTNSKGEFRLDGVAPGKYAVMTTRSNFGLDLNQPKVYSDPVPFEVIDADVSDVELKAHKGLVVSGTVVTDTITNRAALAVVSRLVVSGFSSPPSGVIQTITTNNTSAISSDGTFQLEGLRPGKVLLSVGGFGADSRGFSVSRITAGDRDVPNRQLELSQGQNISGVRIYVQYGTGVVKGDVKITGGTLPPETTMMVWLQMDNQSARVGGTTVDSRGHFMVTGIPAGTYDAVLTVLAFGPNSGNSFPKPVHQTVTVTDDAEAQLSFTLDLTKKEGP